MLPIEKQLEILSKSFQRNGKDLSLYQQEELEQCIRIERMRADGKDSHDISKQEEVLQETKSMIPLAEERICKCYEELKMFLEINESSIEPNSPQLAVAKELIQRYEYPN